MFGKDVLGTFNAWNHNAEEVEDEYALTGNDVPLNSLEITLPRLVAGASRTFDLFNDFSLQAAADLDITFDGKRNTLIRTELLSIDPKAGFELGYRQLAFFRFGFNQFQQIKDFDGTTSWTFQPNMGIGVRLSEVTIDYALTDIGDLAPVLFSHVFSIKVDFNGESN